MSSKQKQSKLNFPIPRSEVEGMNAYSAPLENRRGLLRLDFNENTIGPSPKVIQALRNIPSNHIAIYPEYNGLKEALISNISIGGFSHSLNTNQVGIFNGVDAAIHAIFHAYGDKKKTFLTTTPTFGYYKPCAQMQGMEIVELPYEGRNFNFPLHRVLNNLEEKKPTIFFICNPNNPTGSNIRVEEIVNLARKAPNTLIVVDELYEAFGGKSLLPIVNFQTTPNIIILRSLSKTAGLAGLRVGFALGNAEIIERVQRVTGPYDVNIYAVVAAFAALEDQAYIDNYISKVMLAKKWIKNKMIANNINHHIDCGNYFLVWPKKNPTEIVSSLKSAGILVRNMAGKDLISGSLRVSVGTTNQMKEFWNSFSEAEG